MKAVATAIVVLTLLVATGFGLVNLAHGARKQLRAVRSNDAQPYNVRYGGGAAGIDVDHRFTLAALAFVRGRDTFAIVTGPRVQPSNSYTFPFMFTYFIGRLQPARYVSPKLAEWILCYGCDPSTFPEFDSVWDADNAYYILHRRS